MATPQNSYFLNLARSAESVAMAERGVLLYPHNHIEVLASILQALLMTLGGGQPNSTAMPPEMGEIGLNDLVQVLAQKPNLTWQEFVPFFPFGTFMAGTIASVPADGSAKATALYANSFAFPTTTLYVVSSVKNNYQSNAWQLSCQNTNYTSTGFDVNVSGGPTSSTVSVDYIAVGS